MAAGKGPVPYQQFKPGSSEELPEGEISNQQRRFRTDLWFWIGAVGFGALAVAVWPLALVTAVCAGLATALAVIGVIYLARARHPSDRPAKPPLVAVVPENSATRDRKNRWLRAGLLGLATAVILVAAFQPWFAYTVVNTNPANGTTTTQVETLYLGQNLATTLSYCQATCLSSTSWVSYASVGLPSTGEVYLALQFTIIAAAILAGIAAALSIAPDLPYVFGRWERPLALFAGLAALLSVLLLWVVQPLTWSADIQAAPGGGGVLALGSGPWTTFTGFTNYATFNVAWGPEVGLALALAASIVILIAAWLPARLSVAGHVSGAGNRGNLRRERPSSPS